MAKARKKHKPAKPRKIKVDAGLPTSQTQAFKTPAMRGSCWSWLRRALSA